MKKILLVGAALAAATAVTPAMAQNAASGTVDVTGTVAAKCTTADFTDSINVGELALTDGTVNPALNGVGNDGLSRTFSIQCTGPNTALEIEADPLVNSAGLATPGYTNTVHYTATITAAKAGGGSASASYETKTSVAPGVNTLGDRLANSNLGPNVTVAISNGNTVTPTDLLMAGSYTGQVRVIVSPTAL